MGFLASVYTECRRPEMPGLGRLTDQRVKGDSRRSEISSP